jgi:hypothetical protein
VLVHPAVGDSHVVLLRVELVDGDSESVTPSCHDGFVSDQGGDVTKKRQSWVWITRNEYCLDGDGSDAASLDPASGLGGDGSWWTCHADTRPGDLILLYRGAPKSEIAYLLEARSNPWKLGDRTDDAVISAHRFEGLVDEALAKGVISKKDVDSYREMRDAVFAGRNTASKRRWRLDRLEAIRADHEDRGAELVEREKTEGYNQSIQHGFDNWEEEDKHLDLVEQLEGNEDFLAFDLGEIRGKVFEAAG